MSTRTYYLNKNNRFWLLIAQRQWKWTFKPEIKTSLRKLTSLSLLLDQTFPDGGFTAKDTNKKYYDDWTWGYLGEKRSKWSHNNGGWSIVFWNLEIQWKMLEQWNSFWGIDLLINSSLRVCWIWPEILWNKGSRIWKGPHQRKIPMVKNGWWKFPPMSIFTVVSWIIEIEMFRDIPKLQLLRRSGE